MTQHNLDSSYTLDLDALQREYEGYEADGLPDIGDRRVLYLIQRLRTAERELNNLQEWMLAAKEHVAPAIVKAIEERLPK